MVVPNSLCSERGYHARLRELERPAAELVGGVGDSPDRRAAEL